MIKYTLKCGDCIQSYESWFGSSTDYDDQKSRGLISCPICNSHNIDKELMAPNISTSEKKLSAKEEYKKLKRYIENNFKDVGEKFADEAIAIHYGDQEPENITGKVTPDDSKRLREEGINFTLLPDIKDDA